jgi:DNA-binding response OmpR family regulator
MAHILFFWTDQALAEGVSDLLLIEGHHCSLTNDPETALVTMRNDNIDLLIENLWWPGTESWQLYHAVRDDDALSRVPILVISATPPMEAARKGIQLDGLAGYLTCPFGVADLLEAIDTVLLG